MPEPEELAARAWARIGIYGHLSALPGGLFNIASLGREPARIKKQNIIANNDNGMVGQTSWLPAIAEYQQTGRIPEYAHILAPGLLVTDAEMTPKSSNYGLCAAHPPLLPYTTPGVPRPTDGDIRHFLRETKHVAADGRFAAIYDHLARSIQAASRTIFSDKDFRQTVDAMVSSLEKAGAFKQSDPQQQHRGQAPQELTELTKFASGDPTQCPVTEMPNVADKKPEPTANNTTQGKQAGGTEMTL